MKKYIVLFVFLAAILIVVATSQKTTDRHHIRLGNRQFGKSQFDKAYIEYGKSTSSANQYLATVTPACKTGTFTIAMYFKGSLIRQTKVIVHSADYREVELRRIVSAIDKKLPANPSADDLAVTTAAYVYENFSYDYPPAGDGMDCTQGADILGMVFQSHGYRVMFDSTDDNVKSYYVHPIITTLGHVDAYALDNNGNILTGRPVQGHFLKDWNK